MSDRGRFIPDNDCNDKNNDYNNEDDYNIEGDQRFEGVMK